MYRNLAVSTRHILSGVAKTGRCKAFRPMPRRKPLSHTKTHINGGGVDTSVSGSSRILQATPSVIDAAPRIVVKLKNSEADHGTPLAATKTPIKVQGIKPPLQNAQIQLLATFLPNDLAFLVRRWGPAKDGSQPFVIRSIKVRKGHRRGGVRRTVDPSIWNRANDFPPVDKSIHEVGIGPCNGMPKSFVRTKTKVRRDPTRGRGSHSFQSHGKRLHGMEKLLEAAPLTLAPGSNGGTLPKNHRDGELHVISQGGQLH